MTRKLKKLLYTMSILCFLMSSSILLGSSTDLLSNVDKPENLTEPYSSDINTVNKFYINGTEIFEEGTWHFFLNESLELAIDVTADVDDAYFWYQYSTGGTEYNSSSLSSGTSHDYNQSFYFDGNTQTGLYNAQIILKNTSGSFQNYSFYFDIADPEPVIYAVYLRDVTWKNTWTRIYEGQRWYTYRDTTLEIGAKVGNMDDITSISSVELVYEDGNNTIYDSISMTKGTEETFRDVPVYNYNTSGGIETDFNAGSERNRWIPGDAYDANITATDVNGGEWVFPFKIEILNRAPKITEFEVTGANIPTPSSNGDIVTVTVNVSDLEDDVVYQADNTINVENTLGPASYGIDEEGVNIDWITPGPYLEQIQYVNQLGHQVEIDQNGAYWVNLTVGEFYEKHITSWNIGISYWTNSSNALELWMLNETALGGNGTWYKTGHTFTGSDSGPSWQHDLVIFPSGSDPDVDLEEFCTERYGHQVRLKINKTSAGAINFTLDSINVTYKCDRRYSVTKLELLVWGPRDSLNEFEIIDISDFWDTDWALGNRWSYEYNLTETINGTYTFVVRAYDWGSLITDNIQDVRFINFPLNSRGRVEASYLVNYGVPRGKINNITESGVQVANRDALDPDSSATVTITVSDTTDDTHALKYYNNTVRPQILYQQNGSVYYTVGTNNFTQVELSQLSGDGNYMNENGNNTLNVTMTQESQQSLIFEYRLSEFPWLGEDNITGLKPHWNWFFDKDPNMAFSAIRISFWNWSASDWTSTVWQNSSGDPFSPVPEDNNVTGRVYSAQSWLTDTDSIKDIVNETYSNKVLVRFEIINPSDYQYNLNACIAYQALEIRYDNYFTADAVVFSEDTGTNTYAMADIGHTGTTKQWQVNIPVNEALPNDYMIVFFLQNGNSTARIFAGRYQSYDTGASYKYVVQTGYDEEEWWVMNQTMSVRPRTLSSSVNLGNSYVKRTSDLFQVNGTLSSEAQIAAGNYSSFEIQMRRGGDQLISNWLYYPQVGINFDYQYTTGFWNLSKTFTDVISAGRYYYRLLLTTNDDNVYATEWEDVRILNYQPNVQDYVVDAGTDYYRENTEFDFEMQIRETETNVNDLTLEFVLPCLDRTNDNNPFLWKKQISDPTVEDQGDGVYNISGSFKFSKDIHIGDYDNIYFSITDDDAIWPQTGALRIPKSITILNNAPQIVTSLSSNVTNDDIYRDKTVNLYWNYSDVDDPYPLDNFTFSVFNIEDPDSSITGLNTGDIVYDPLPDKMLFGYNYTFGKTAILGTYTFTIEVEDPDGANVLQTIDIDVLNNLPVVTEIIIENLETGQYATLNQDGNISQFWIKRNTQQFKLTVNLSDVEDSYLGDNQINKVYYEIRHEYSVATSGDPWTSSISWDTNLTILKDAGENGNGIETWTGTYSLPVDTEFYSGPCYLRIYMVDGDDDSGVSGDTLFLVNNSAPKFGATPYQIKIEGVTDATEVIRGQDIKIWVNAEDDDYDPEDTDNGLYISKIDYRYKITRGAWHRTVSVTVNDGEWNVDSSGSIILTLKTDDDNNEIPENPDGSPMNITILSITIYDNDVGYIEDIDLTGDDRATLTEINYQIAFIEPDKPFPIWLIFVIIGAAVGGVVFFIWYYKKYFSYKKYMD
ncbi:MAG: hypothetical protein GF364_21590 [Candidatus Lokiarchaeota archaeon]|nr:hypothetical protein [Candidatus Lokiarchaeota archaeon]